MDEDDFEELGRESETVLSRCISWRMMIMILIMEIMITWFDSLGQCAFVRVSVGSCWTDLQSRGSKDTF